MTNAEQLVNPFMTSRLDYCKAIMGGCMLDKQTTACPKCSS